MEDITNLVDRMNLSKNIPQLQEELDIQLYNMTYSKKHGKYIHIHESTETVKVDSMLKLTELCDDIKKYNRLQEVLKEEREKTQKEKGTTSMYRFKFLTRKGAPIIKPETISIYQQIKQFFINLLNTQK